MKPRPLQSTPRQQRPLIRKTDEPEPSLEAQLKERLRVAKEMVSEAHTIFCAVADAMMDETEERHHTIFLDDLLHIAVETTLEATLDAMLTRSGYVVGNLEKLQAIYAIHRRGLPL